MKVSMKHMAPLILFLFIIGCATTLNDINKWHMEGSEGVPKLIKVTEDANTDAKLRLASVKALGNIGDSRAVQPLLGISLSDKDRSMREAAVNSLISIGKPASQALVKVAEDANTNVKLRLASVKALGNMGDSRAVQPLLGISLSDKDRGMREAANEALDAIGKPAMVGGKVKKIDASSQTLTITTPMGDKEVLQLNSETQIEEGKSKRSLKDLKAQENIKINYIRLPGGYSLVKNILIGHYVPYCSCGSGCPCPISRGCKVVRY